MVARQPERRLHHNRKVGVSNRDGIIKKVERRGNLDVVEFFNRRFLLRLPDWQPIFKDSAAKQTECQSGIVSVQ